MAPPAQPHADVCRCRRWRRAAPCPCSSTPATSSSTSRASGTPRLVRRACFVAIVAARELTHSVCPASRRVPRRRALRLRRLWSVARPRGSQRRVRHQLQLHGLLDCQELVGRGLGHGRLRDVGPRRGGEARQGRRMRHQHRRDDVGGLGDRAMNGRITAALRGSSAVPSSAHHDRCGTPAVPVAPQAGQAPRRLHGTCETIPRRCCAHAAPSPPGSALAYTSPPFTPNVDPAAPR